MSFTFCRSSSSLWETETQFIISHDIPADCFCNCACLLITVVLYLTEGFSLKMSDLFCWLAHLSKSSNTFPDLQQTPAILTLSFHKIHLLQRPTHVGTCPSCLTTFVSRLFEDQNIFFSRQQQEWCNTFFWSSVIRSLIIPSTSLELTDDFLEEVHPATVASEEVVFKLRRGGSSSFLSLLSLPLFKYVI